MMEMITPDSPCPFFLCSWSSSKNWLRAALPRLLTIGLCLSENNLQKNSITAAGALQRNELRERCSVLKWNHIWVLLKAKPSLQSVYDCHSWWFCQTEASDWSLYSDNGLWLADDRWWSSHGDTCQVFPTANSLTDSHQPRHTHRGLRGYQSEAMIQTLWPIRGQAAAVMGIKIGAWSGQLRWKVTVGTDRDQRRLIESLIHLTLTCAMTRWIGRREKLFLALIGYETFMYALN